MRKQLHRIDTYHAAELERLRHINPSQTLFDLIEIIVGTPESPANLALRQFGTLPRLAKQSDEQVIIGISKRLLISSAHSTTVVEQFRL